MRAILTTAFCTALLATLPAIAQTDKPAGKKAATAKSTPKGRNHSLARGAQKAVEEATPIDDDPSLQLTDTEIEVAKRVETGDMPCELGASVKVAAARRTGLFVVTTKGFRFLMHPVESRTGAIRLEDPKRGAMWLQLGNKSMLMSQKLGQRLADECQSSRQKDYAEELRRNPRPSILDAPQPAVAKPQEALPPGTPASAAPGTLPAGVPVAPASGPALAASAAAASASAPAPAQ